MDVIRFWAVVASLGPELAPARLAVVLDALSRTDLDGFCGHLADAEDELDTPDHRAQAQAAYEIDRHRTGLHAGTAPEEQQPVDFGDLQATVVAHGRDAWSA